MMITQLHSLIHKNLDPEEQKLFKDDVEKIETYLRENYDKRGKRSGVFFSAGNNLWKVLEFVLYLKELLHLDSPR